MFENQVLYARYRSHVYYGEMAERFKAAVLKTVGDESLPGVRIPLSPPSPAIASSRRRARWTTSTVFQCIVHYCAGFGGHSPPRSSL